MPVDDAALASEASYRSRETLKQKTTVLSPLWCPTRLRLQSRLGEVAGLAIDQAGAVDELRNDSPWSITVEVRPLWSV